MKPTPAQARMLTALAPHGTLSIYSKYFGDRRPQCRVLEACKENGWLASGWETGTLTITESGKAIITKN